MNPPRTNRVQKGGMKAIHDIQRAFAVAIDLRKHPAQNVVLDILERYSAIVFEPRNEVILDAVLVVLEGSWREVLLVVNPPFQVGDDVRFLVKILLDSEDPVFFVGPHARKKALGHAL